ncbi:Bacterial alpha-L-rhamnosidase [Ginsengibacter hankyongi]|uniref:alpha-L-rhamnosidase n=1 Tax=Ginsengibacter hankyongi TaxID=2607284 RepID=A0A5J5IF40_9BACT|nr:family 78 glycoside hydrolase catalytic domain [Ginsengibacter hankyongi]KAA9036083.1 Bacterial alpha-L-rhamnosidase [Ginsengibacter hankyongi]
MLNRNKLISTTDVNKFHRILLLVSSLSLTLIGYASPIRKGKKINKELSVQALSCEYQNDPLGLDMLHPRLGWIMNITTDERGQYQTAFRIQVASSTDKLLSGKPDLWDSRKVDTSQSNNIIYNGKTLRSNMRCYWRVQVWDNYHHMSKWSQIANWTMGLLTDSDWKGKWIEDTKSFSPDDSILYDDNPAPLFRREFKIQKKISRAIMYVSGIGYYEAYLNGKRIGKKLLDPGWTDYSKRILYSTYNVTSYLKADDNCLGISLGNGWYNPLPLKMWGRIDLRKSLSVGNPKFIMQMNIEYSDGTTDQIVSDNTWKVTSGPVIRNNIYLGEVYDARKEIPGWNKAGLKTDNWRQAKFGKTPGGKLRSEQQPPIVAADTILPIQINKTEDGKYIVDFGRNFGGIIRLKIRGRSGTVINIRYGELLYPNGSLNVMTSTAGQIKSKGEGGVGAPDTAYARDIFISGGTGEEIFQTHFTFHGFRYAELTGYPGMLTKEDIKGLVLYSNVADAGSFVCSDPFINQLQQVCRNTFRSNIFSVQSDCPHRERFGYGGDIVATCEAFMNNFDMSGFYEKTVNDFSDAARTDGGLTETAPFVGVAGDGLGGKSGPVEWGSVLPVLLNRLYQYYGDIELIRQQYQTAKNWVDFMNRHADHGIINITIGDHESLEPKAVALSATAFFYYNTMLLTKFAKMLNKSDDFTKYSSLTEMIKAAFISRFFDRSTGDVDIHTAAAQAYALYFNLIPDGSEDAVLKVLLHDVTIVNKNHIAAGIFGTKFLLEVLGKTGNNDIAYRMVTQKTFPGWGYMRANGATTLWEHWSLSDNTYSHNHPMFGTVSEWFYRYLAGIRPAEKAAGYNQIIIQPQIADLRWAKASYKSMLGEVSSYWKKTGKTFTMDITIPVNATAVVYIPSGLDDLKEGGIAISDARTIHSIGKENNESVFQLGSGNYHFSALLSDD